MAALSGCLALAAVRPVLRPDPPKTCGSCDAWNTPQEPFRVFGNTYYVGVKGISAVLLASDGGLILFDGGLPQSAPLIEASIRGLGFRAEDIRLIGTSHAHFDHVGGIAALQRLSGATVVGSASTAAALKRGGPPVDDPQYALGPDVGSFPRVKDVRVVADGETLRAAGLAITAHLTPGHTPGSTSWSWRSCEGARCLDIVYADSLNPVSAPGFRFTGGSVHESIEPIFRRSIAAIAGLPCDVLLTPHPEFTGVERPKPEKASTSAFVDPHACLDYAAEAKGRLDRRVAEEQSTLPPRP
jgi:metallo-beta-lactamase class B